MKEIKIEFENRYKAKIRGILKLKKEPFVYIFVHGFLRNTNEEKFRAFDESLDFSCLYLDFEGCGRSEGTTKNLTVQNWTEDLEMAIECLQKYTKSDFSFFAHSLGSCVVANFLKRNPQKIENIVLMAPALNQRELHRYWFVKGRSSEATWENFRNFLDEEEFQKYCEEDKKVKGKIIGKEYFLENKDKNYEELIRGREEYFIHLHGDNDSAVPLESISLPFRRKCIVEGGDHDLEGEFSKIWIRYLREVLR